MSNLFPKKSHQKGNSALAFLALVAGVCILGMLLIFLKTLYHIITGTPWN